MDKIFPLFMPSAAKTRQNFQARNGRFVHYTSAENGLSILRTKQFWMRNVKCMNDYMEIEHGFENLQDFFEKDSGTNIEYFKTMDKIYPGIAKEAIDSFNSHLSNIRFGTYVACVSEHEDDEDAYGRLSMWRAYGGSSNGIAIVLKRDPFYIRRDIGISSAPVNYFSKNDLFNELKEINFNVDKNIEIIKLLNRDQFKAVIFNKILYATVGTKHKGFREEKEWRVMFNPELWETKGVVDTSIEAVNGVPQKVFKINLINRPDIGLVGIEPNSLIDRIIIGPSRYSYIIYDALVAELEKLNVEKADEKVCISNIPLRT